MSSGVRIEAQVGVLASLVCVVAAMLVARSMVPGFVALLSSLLIASLCYVTIIPFSTPLGAAPASLLRLALAEVSLALLAAVSFVGLRKLKR